MNSGSPAPVVWLLTDRKPGHENQLRGLGNRLRVLCGAELHWLNCTEHPVSLWRALLGLRPASVTSLPSPALIIAAGSATHRLLLALRRFKKARTLVLMKPAFPGFLVDARILPAHDGVAAKRRTLLSDGPLNAIPRMARRIEKPEALVLLGGPSAHYRFDETGLLQQLHALMQAWPGWRWTLADSRRTPDSLRRQLAAMASPRVTVVSHEQTRSDWLMHTLAGCRAAWVTPESASMVYETLTAGLPTGVFDLPVQSPGRISRGLDELVEQERVHRWPDHAPVMTPAAAPQPRLWESDSAARWVIDTLLHRQTAGRRQ